MIPGDTYSLRGAKRGNAVIVRRTLERRMVERAHERLSRSSCCGAKIKAHGNLRTRHYRCQGCGQRCEPVTRG